MPQLNSFGSAFAANGSTWSAGLASQDSDGDGFSNGEELGDPDGNGSPTPGVQPTNPGDPASRPTATAPSITTQPANQTVTAGGNATFTVVATGPEPLTYQWQRNGVDIPGATSSTLSLNSVTAANAGTYTVVVTGGGGGTVTSSGATLTVTTQTTGPEITSQPASQTVAAGGNATFTVVAAGTGPLTYQWRRNGVDIPGATDPTLSLTSVTAANAGTYTVVVTGAGGATATSSAATLTVTDQTVGPVITIQPVSQTVAPGESVTLTVAATGTAPLTFQWQFNGADIPGETNASLTLSEAQAGDAGTYSVVVTDAAGSVTSSGAVITVQDGGTATFVRGVYNGLFFEPDGVSPESAGAFTLKTTTEGRYSGRLQLGRSRHSLSGEFDQAGHAQRTISRGGDQGPLEVVLQLDPADSDTITGTVSDGTFTASLLGHRTVFDRRDNPAPQAGRYTLVIPGSEDSAAAPGGDSYGTVRVDESGRIRLAGSLADGTKLSQSTHVSEAGDWPFHVPLYRRQGLIQGWLKFAETPNDLGGDVVWIKPEVPRSRLYPEGFELIGTVNGSRYERPASGNNVLTFTEGEVLLSGGGFGEIVNQITLEPRNRVVNQSSNRLRLSFSPSTGLFKGRVTDPSTAMFIRFSGVVLQRDNVGSGWFIANDQSGKVTIQAAEGASEEEVQP